MSNSAPPRLLGDDYQLLVFWLHACRLFTDHPTVSRVGYELPGAKGFDDVAVFYQNPIPDERGDPVSADYFQVKFHMNRAGAFTWEDLMSPKFINASSISLLQRLRVAQEDFAPRGVGARFQFCTAWPVDAGDPLAELVSNQGGEIRLDVLFDGRGTRSKMGRVRDAWRNHLGLADEQALKQVLRPLRIRPNTPPVDELRGLLNDRLRLAGFDPVPPGSFASPYSELIRRFRVAGHSEFTRRDLENIGRREGIWRPSPTLPPQTTRLGIRSFMRFAEHLEDETDGMLCLVRHFDDRWIRDPALWRSAVFPEIEAFLDAARRHERSVQIHLNAHASIAFAAGYCLDTKSGLEVTVMQRTVEGQMPWVPRPPAPDQVLPEWVYTMEDTGSGGSEAALVLSATHNIAGDVRLYVGQALPQVGRLLVCALAPHPSLTGVADGSHALMLVDNACHWTRQNRTPADRAGTLHIFAAAPNGMHFLLGQRARSFGPCRVYEYAFDRNTPGGYEPALEFPP